MQRARGKFGPRALGFAGQVAVDSVDHNSVILSRPKGGGVGYNTESLSYEMEALRVPLGRARRARRVAAVARSPNLRFELSY